MDFVGFLFSALVSRCLCGHCTVLFGCVLGNHEMSEHLFRKEWQGQFKMKCYINNWNKRYWIYEHIFIGDNSLNIPLILSNKTFMVISENRYHNFIFKNKEEIEIENWVFAVGHLLYKWRCRSMSPNLSDLEVHFIPSQNLSILSALREDLGLKIKEIVWKSRWKTVFYSLVMVAE